MRSPRRPRASPCLLLLLLLFLHGALAAAQSPGAPPFTQHRINEIAAACVVCEEALSGLKGTRKPGETPAQFAMRVHRYISALETAVADVEPVRHPQRPRDARPENLQRWKKIADDANRLGNEVKLVRAAWQVYPIQGERAQLGPKLLRALETVEEILNGLRDSRP